ncbi:flavin-containing monooxygenase [Microbulbifer hydrolyticus]|uniref:Cation diffusion facilitator CzcD-associated flavoprotein CzcO n=1 Tax=Microbulbifer hydrolyticus TaxID=48074 RepID=A0A6P1T7J6_9GAMM|nr:NAD(P)/FAD-dependent oxidoreductase [Microbulbifer hydrolyticus]MBB5210840.1 cation diffusion facilitator CzcD-associated flavoprotein CzcO [Microbulbifer hydrolyticus]QHQ38728.1 NAD(P)-binding domain-containing protein [Microbulbifer hydrolyticus]
MPVQHFETLIIGAGLSGIGSACHLRQHCPNREFAILERRERLGGTWDLFRYPGIRSDSDMFTFGFSFRPWNGDQVLADGPSIRNYLQETADQFQVSEHIHYGVDLTAASWSSNDQLWTLTGTRDGETATYTCSVLISCTGYYDYARGHEPKFAGTENFQGLLVHPQHWPQELDYTDKNIVVIGSGATAVTLVPALAEKARHVTMLQRSPTYILSMPGRDRLLGALKKLMPEALVYRFARWRNLRLHRLMFKASKRWPRFMRKLMLRGVRKALSGSADMRHFTPEYLPWDQRLCAVPDGDLFEAVKSGKASVVTDEIDAFTERGIRLKSGSEIEADIAVSATGLKLQLLGGMALSVDGQPVDMRNRLTYKGVLMEGVPNMAWVFGYTNAAWTLKSDLSAGYICRLLNHLDKHGLGVFLPVDREGCVAEESVMAALQSGYVQRADGILPRQGTRYPWRLLNDYERDKKILLTGPLEDGVLNFYPSVRGAKRKDIPTETETV